MSLNAPQIHGDDLAAFGPRNIILTGKSKCYHVPSFAGPPSIKWMRYGSAHWTVRGGRREVRPDTMLLLPDGEEYALTIDSPTPSRTFCPVFRRGLIDGAIRAAVSTPQALLDAPHAVPAADFRPRRESCNGPVGLAVTNLAQAFDSGRDPETLGWLFEQLAAAFAASVVEQAQASDRLPGLRPATRWEIHRRLNLAREAMEDQLDLPWDLVAMGRAACMAPHHFQRCFRQAFDETPRDWLARRRGERAMALLQTTTMTVTEVCMAVGYHSLGSFSAAFARRFGGPPSAFAAGARFRAL